MATYSQLQWEVSSSPLTPHSFNSNISPTPGITKYVLTRVIFGERCVKINELVVRDVPFWIRWGFEIQVILPVTIELGSCNVHADHNLVGVARFLNGRLQQFQGCKRTVKI